MKNTMNDKETRILSRDLGVSSVAEIAHKHPLLCFLSLPQSCSPTINNKLMQKRAYRNTQVVLSLQKFIFLSSSQERKAL